MLGGGPSGRSTMLLRSGGGLQESLVFCWVGVSIPEVLRWNINRH